MSITNKPEFKKLKKEAAKVGDEVLRFKDLKEPILTRKLASFFSHHVQLIYTAGLIAFVVALVVSVLRWTSVSELIMNIVIVLVTFVIFRMLCEILSTYSKGMIASEAKPVAVKAVAKPVAVKKEAPAKKAKPAKKAVKKVAAPKVAPAKPAEAPKA